MSIISTQNATEDSKKVVLLGCFLTFRRSQLKETWVAKNDWTCYPTVFYTSFRPLVGAGAKYIGVMVKSPTLPFCIVKKRWVKSPQLTVKWVSKKYRTCYPTVFYTSFRPNNCCQHKISRHHGQIDVSASFFETVAHRPHYYGTRTIQGINGLVF